MSGWIKLEKDRRDDPRVLRMARELRHAGVTHERFMPSMHVTLVLGCLDVFWCYADTHIREDDTLDLGPDEIDELVGLKDFCRLLPSDWLEILDENRVKLPDFTTHNGTESKKKALAQKRQERHRNASASTDETLLSRSSVTDALPDQTRPRPDQDLEEEHVSRRNGARVPSRHIDTIFEHWKSEHGHPQAKCSEKRRRLIAARLKDYELEQLRECISGYRLSPFHRGENERAEVYDSIELMLRDAEHVERGIGYFNNPPEISRGTSQQNSKPSRREAARDKLQEWVESHGG